jgi:hypothetical protein
MGLQMASGGMDDSPDMPSLSNPTCAGHQPDDQTILAPA